MKRILVFLMTIVMVLSFTGCGETAKQAKLYEKYAEVITELENQEYNQAIASVAGMAAEAQAEERLAKDEKDREAVAQSLLDEWHLWSRSNEEKSVPQEVIISADGTCTIDGKEMKWMENGASNSGIEGVVVDGKENLYYFYH